MAETTRPPRDDCTCWRCESCQAALDEAAELVSAVRDYMRATGVIPPEPRPPVRRLRVVK